MTIEIVDIYTKGTPKTDEKGEPILAKMIVYRPKRHGPEITEASEKDLQQRPGWRVFAKHIAKFEAKNAPAEKPKKAKAKRKSKKKDAQIDLEEAIAEA